MPGWQLLRRLGCWVLRLLWLSILLPGCDSSGGYQRKAGQWHFENSALSPADPASFKPLGPVFAHDTLQAYYRGVAIAGSDGASVVALSEHEARDRSHVYWADTHRKAQEYWSVKHVRVSVIAGADPARYRSLGHDYGGDGRSVFYEGLAFKVRDPASFVPISPQFGRDAQRAYFERIEISDSDGASFALIETGDLHHARDRYRVYHFQMVPVQPAGTEAPRPVVQVLQGARPDSVQILGRGYARDGSLVWWQGRQLMGADAATFQIEEDSSSAIDARDSKGSFRDGRRALAAPAPAPRAPG